MSDSEHQLLSEAMASVREVLGALLDKGADDEGHPLHALFLQVNSADNALLEAWDTIPEEQAR